VIQLSLASLCIVIFLLIPDSHTRAYSERANALTARVITRLSREITLAQISDSPSPRCALRINNALYQCIALAAGIGFPELPRKNANLQNYLQKRIINH